MKKMVRIFTLVFTVSMFTTGIVYANGAVPITAEQAFDAYANQEDPETGLPANVAIVDVRTTAEYYWVGTCAQVDEIITIHYDEDGDKISITPHNGKVILNANSGNLEYEYNNEEDSITQGILNVNEVVEIITSPIARLIPNVIQNNMTYRLSYIK